jgi:hypothetical protein
MPAPAWLSATFVLAPLAAWTSVVVTIWLVIGVTALFAVGGGYLLLIGLMLASPSGRRGLRGSPSTRLDGEHRPAREGVAS